MQRRQTLDPQVSVIVPCFNTARFLAEAVASALNQTFTDLEVLIIDDGSTDATPEVAARFLHNKRVSYHWQDNRGLSAARNTGIELSRGKFIALLDADDVWAADKLASQMELFAHLPDCGLVFTDFSTFDEEGVIAAEKNSVIQGSLKTLDFQVLYGRNNFIYPSTAVIRRELFQRVGGFDMTLRSAEDYDMWLRIAQVSQVAGIGARLVRIRQHGANMSLNVGRMLENELAVLEKHAAAVPRQTVTRRRAKAYYLNADRLVHAGRRLQALKLFMRGISTSPLLFADIAVVLIKLTLGGPAVQWVRRYLNNKDSALSRLYWSIYSRY